MFVSISFRTFGVVFWEILEFAKKPYIDLTNDDVIEQVIRRRSAILPEPLSPVPLREKWLIFSEIFI